MAAPNEQAFVGKKLITVTLVAGSPVVHLTVGVLGVPSTTEPISIEPFLAAGMDERAAMRAVIAIASTAVRLSER